MPETIVTPKPAAGEVPPNSIATWMETNPTIPDAALSDRPASAGFKADAPKTDIPPVETDPKPPEKPAEPKIPDAKPTDEGEEKWPRSAKDWDAFKAKRKEKEILLTKERDAIKAEADAIKAEIETLRKAGPSPELEELRKERDDLSERIRLIDVEKHPKFQAYFNNQINAQLELAKRIAGDELAPSIIEAIKMPDGAYKDQRLEELVAGLSPLQQSRIGSVLTRLDAINQERSAEIANAKANYEQMTAKEKEAAEKQSVAQKAQTESAFTEVLTKATDPKEGLFLFQKREGDEAWNKEVDQRVAYAKSLFTGQHKPQDLVQASLYAVALPGLLKAYTTEKQQHAENIAKLEAQVKALSAANPSVTAGSTQVTTGAPSRKPIKIGMSPMEASAAWVSNLTSPTE